MYRTGGILWILTQVLWFQWSNQCQRGQIPKKHKLCKTFPGHTSAGKWIQIKLHSKINRHSMNWRRRVSNANARCFKMSNGCGIPFQRLLNVPKCAMVGWQKWQIPKWPVQVPFHHRRSLSHRGPLMWITRIAALSMARITRITALLMVASIQLLLQIAGVLCVTRSLIFHISPHVLIFLLFMFLMISSLHNASKAIVGSICRVGAVRGP